MQKVDFPDIRVPARERLTTYYINDTVRQYMEAAEYKLREMKLFGLATGLDKDDAAEAADRLMRIRDRKLQNLVADTVRDVMPFLYWKESREIYDVHPAMTRSLMGMGSTATIPGSVFRRLRHPNPFFSLTGCPEFMHADGKPGRVMGFYVSGAVSDEYPRTDGGEMKFRELDVPGTAFAKPGRRASLVRSTHDPVVNGLHVMVMSEVLSPDRGRVLDFDVCHLTLPITADFTLDGLVAEISENGFRWSQEMTGPLGGTPVIGDYLRMMARVVVSHMLYACSRTSEISEGKNDRPPVRPGSGKPKVKPAKTHQVGYRIGAKIEDNMRWLRERQEAGVPTGRKQPPHMRAAHAHLYRVGPGKKEVEVRFLDPIPVNMKDDDGVTATIHPMGPER
jgi:hypothetical protein